MLSAFKKQKQKTTKTESLDMTFNYILNSLKRITTHYRWYLVSSTTDLTCFKVVRTKDFKRITLAGIKWQHGLACLFHFVFLLWKLKWGKINEGKISAVMLGLFELFWIGNFGDGDLRHRIRHTHIWKASDIVCRHLLVFLSWYSFHESQGILQCCD